MHLKKDFCQLNGFVFIHITNPLIHSMCDICDLVFITTGQIKEHLHQLIPGMKTSKQIFEFLL